MLEAAVRYVNTHGEGWPNSLAYQLVTSNTQAQLHDLEEHFKNPGRDWNGQPDIDCVVAAVMSWGHHEEARRERNRASDTTDCEAVEGFRAQARLGEYYDWILEVSEFAMNLSNRHLWLGTDDHDWHTPLHVIIRPRRTANLRKRSDEAKARRYARWKAGPPRPGDQGPAHPLPRHPRLSLHQSQSGHGHLPNGRHGMPLGVQVIGGPGGIRGPDLRGGMCTF